MGEDRIYETDDGGAPFRFNDNVARVFPDMLKRSIPGYPASIEAIGALLQGQTESIREAAELMQGVSGRTASNEEAGARMSEATRELVSQAEALHRDVERFTIE